MIRSPHLLRGALAAVILSAVPCLAPASPLDLSGIANRSLTDPVGYDGAGGWFDQGPENDLAGLPPGLAERVNVPFLVGEKEKAALVLAGSAQPALPQSAALRFDTPLAGGWFYLFHGAGWMPPKGTRIGTITFYYADGSQGVEAVVSGRDIADWWNPAPLANGAVAWKGPARGGFHGLYVSEFKTKPQPVAAVIFRSERNAVWGIVGANLSQQRMPLPPEVPFVAKAGKDWRPYKASLTVLPGSALDFSSLLDAPAGKYGFVTEKDGHFAFENAPDARLRFHGTNLCYSANYPEKKDAPRIAEYLAKMGYNVVRFHHYDGLLTENRKNSLDIDWALYDRMEYLIAECEKRGMYVVIDLFSFRKIKDGEIPGVSGDIIAAFKAVPPVSEAGFENWKSFATAILTHKNPYTSKTLAEDPALVGVCPVNEDPLGTVWRENASVAAIYDGLFAEWKKESGVDPKGWNEEQQALSRFLNSIQLKGDRMYEDFLKNTLRVKAPLTGTNCLVAIPLTETRSRYDYVDNHIYWDHPDFPEASWKLPYRYHQLSAIESGVHVPRTLFPSRIAGRPFTVTEWNYCNPNRYRAEGAPLLFAYAAFQDWDGLYRFAESHDVGNLLNQQACTGFDLVTDPLSQLGERAAGLMFLRGDIAPAKGLLTCAVDSANGYRVISGWAQEGFEEPIEYAGLLTGVASVWAEGAAPDSLSGPLTGSVNFAGNPSYMAPDANLLASLEAKGFVPAGSFDPAKGRYVSDTGEIVAGVNDGTFTLAAPRCVWLIANHGGTLSAGGASVTFDSGPSSVAALSLDGAPLEKSRRILVLHLTEMANSGESFTSAEMRTLTGWGKLPHLARSGRATFCLPSEGGLRAWALDATGKRVREVKLAHKDGLLTIVLDNTKGKEATLAYELADQ